MNDAWVMSPSCNIQNLGDSGKSGLADINKSHKRYSVDMKFMFMSYSDIEYYSWQPDLDALMTVLALLGAPDINFMFMSYSLIIYYSWPPGF
jgi:hypothetical protein